MPPRRSMARKRDSGKLQSQMTTKLTTATSLRQPPRLMLQRITTNLCSSSNARSRNSRPSSRLRSQSRRSALRKPMKRNNSMEATKPRKRKVAKRRQPNCQKNKPIKSRLNSQERWTPPSLATTKAMMKAFQRSKSCLCLRRSLEICASRSSPKSSFRSAAAAS